MKLTTLLLLEIETESGVVKELVGTPQNASKVTDLKGTVLGYSVSAYSELRKSKHPVRMLTGGISRFPLFVSRGGVYICMDHVSRVVTVLDRNVFVSKYEPTATIYEDGVDVLREWVRTDAHNLVSVRELTFNHKTSCTEYVDLRVPNILKLKKEDPELYAKIFKRTLIELCSYIPITYTLSCADFYGDLYETVIVNYV